MSTTENHIKTVFEKDNNQCLDAYTTNEIHQHVFLNEEDIRVQIKKIPLDISAGPDR